METKKVEVVNPYSQKHLQMINHFCLHNNITNLAKKLQEITFNKDEKTYFEQKLATPVFDDYLLLTEKDMPIDYCHIHGERDIRQAFLTFPNLLDKKHAKKRTLIKPAIDYAFTLGMEEVFVIPDNQDINLQQNLIKLGFTSLGSDETNTPYVLAKEEVKDKVLI